MCFPQRMLEKSNGLEILLDCAHNPSGIFRAFKEITLPQIKFSLISASLIAFLTSFDEVIISLFVAGGDNSTITRSMLLALRDQIDPTIAAISTILILISSGLLLIVQLIGSKEKKP